MNNFFIYFFLILSVAVCLCTADDGESEDKPGKITKTLNGIGKAADVGAAAINKATDKTAHKVEEIRSHEPHVHGQGKLIPSAYQGARRLVNTVIDETGNVAKSIVTSVRNTGKAVGETIKYSAQRLLPRRCRTCNNEANGEE